MLLLVSIGKIVVFVKAKSMAHHIHDILTGCLPSDRWELQLLQLWPSIIGNLQEHVHIEKMHNSTLILGVYDSSWLQELYMLSPLLLKKINEQLENHTIQQIRFKHTAHKPKTTLRKKTYTKQNTIPVELSKKEQHALASITDKDLQSALIEYLSRCKRIE